MLSGDCDTTPRAAFASRAMRQSPRPLDARARTVAEAIKALEGADVLTWVNRIKRVREAGRIRVLRTSNGYAFHDPKSSKSDFQPGTEIQALPSTLAPHPAVAIDATTELGAAILRLKAVRRPAMEPS